jgi:hypothetical protein
MGAPTHPAIDGPAVALSLRDASRSLGQATLALRAGDGVRAGLLICRALRSLAAAESSLPIMADANARRP